MESKDLGQDGKGRRGDRNPASSKNDPSELMKVVKFRKALPKRISYNILKGLGK